MENLPLEITILHPEAYEVHVPILARTTISIYVLLDPRTNRVCYVGQTSNPQKRLQMHRVVSPHLTSRKHQWVCDLRGVGLAPRLVVIQSVQAENADEEEKKWIAFYRSQGTDLLNSPPGPRQS